MDAFVQLALMEKCRQVFGSDSTFLSFPLASAFSWTPSQTTGMNAPATAGDYAAAAEFAQSVNFIPRDLVANVDGETFLWDVYDDVLSGAQVAVGKPPSTYETAAAAVLYDTAADGTRTETAAYRMYRQYRDAWIAARQNYNAQRLTAESSSDPVIQQRWNTVDEPTLRAAVADAKAAWEQQGRKAEIESALETYEQMTVDDPKLAWSTWQGSFNEDIDLITDPTSQLKYAPTGFSPRNLSSNDAWLHFDLASAEMAALVDAAPTNLKAVLGSQTASQYQHVSFEYRSVAVVRPWFQSAVFTSRSWQQPGEEPLSDGGDPPNGRCPAYVSAIVFVRHVAVVPAAGHGAPAPERGPIFSLPTQLLTERKLVLEPQLQTRMAMAPSERDTGAVTDAPVVNTPLFRRLDTESFIQAPRSQPAQPVASITMMRMAAAPTRQTPPAGATPEVGAARFIPPAFRFDHGPVRGAGHLGDLGTVVPVDPSQPPPPPSPPPPNDDVQILAFICKRLPKAPDPLPDLHWT
ncbi:hypothetical protein Mycch_0196 [Mycolicibacterium chubuense NBB4]|uniref:Uncharacterized protein n=1 Tax=Mycolicibacterium chubuense (strain NBB4) TaxID=710421 RepID=I4BCL5_MYCCN|nr:hypothetical protein [Mycolicibacterium chubuense]AFM15022.1 hypothetical protein Mycch_0196 [Mycolicibacterium chubuense NBB4]